MPSSPRSTSVLSTATQALTLSSPSTLTSDDEQSIHPESLICTLSLGSQCTVKFRESDTNQEETVVCDHASLYSMTKRSQNFYQHRIETGSIAEGTRYSLTFRSVSRANKNSTCVIGDSNTCNIKFGTGKGTLGYHMPGKQVFAPHVKDIDPLTCLAYSNVVILCGVNDVRSSDVRSANDIKNIYFRLKLKINQIQQLNRKANVYICLMLPTKLPWLNQRGAEFNRLINGDLLPFNLGVTAVDGFAQFLDRRLLLSERLAKNVDKYGNPDTLHLSGGGTGLLVNLIKSAINSRSYGGLYRPNRRLGSRVPGSGSNERRYSRADVRRVSVSSRDTRGPPTLETEGYQAD